MICSNKFTDFLEKCWQHFGRSICFATPKSSLKDCDRTPVFLPFKGRDLRKLLSWILCLWPESEKRLALAADASTLSDRFTV
ncbi:MAG: hypothetical protein V7L25_00145, partial [Nostoc sp.]